LAAQAVFHARAVALLFLGKDALVVRLSRAQQMKQNASQFVSRGGNSLGSAQAGAHAAIVGAQIRLTAVQGLGGDPQGPIHSVTRPASFARQDLPAALFIVGDTPSQAVKAETLAKRDKSGPISAKAVCTVMALSPGTAVRSTPKIRYKWVRRSKRYSFLRGL